MRVLGRIILVIELALFAIACAPFVLGVFDRVEAAAVGGTRVVDIVARYSLETTAHVLYVGGSLGVGVLWLQLMLFRGGRWTSLFAAVPWVGHLAFSYHEAYRGRWTIGGCIAFTLWTPPAAWKLLTWHLGEVPCGWCGGCEPTWDRLQNTGSDLWAVLAALVLAAGRAFWASGVSQGREPRAPAPKHSGGPTTSTAA